MSRSTQLVRTCPRCKVRLYHQARIIKHPTKRSRVWVEVDCNGCGHTFLARYLQRDWE